MSKDLDRLLSIETLRTLKSQQALARIQAEETRLRRQIDTLRGHRKQSHSTDTDLMPMRAIGSDVLWQAWIDRTQADLTTDLARLLVRKEPVQRRAQRDIGRKNVVGELKVAEDMRVQAERQAAQLTHALETAACGRARAARAARADKP